MDETHQEIELSSRRTAWVRGLTNTRMGTAVLSTERLLFYEGREGGRPLLDLSLSSITEITHEPHGLGRDRITVTTNDASYVFADGWSEWSGLLAQALKDRHGREIVAETVERWQIRS